jgi:phosphatidylglycerol:prolipoprotein diacylglycerol transferase
MDWLAPGSNPQLGMVFTFLGYVTGAVVYVLVARHSAVRSGITSRQSGILLIWAIIVGILGAKLTQWIYLGWPVFWSASILDFSAGGRTILGGLITGWIAVETAKWRMGIRSSTGLPFALALPAGEAVGRIGCWFNGCCLGKETANFVAVSVGGVARHPTQAYHFVAAVLILIALLLIRPRLKIEGHLFRYYLVLWGISRFVIEFFRVQDQLFLGLSLAQWLSLELALAGGIMILWTAARDSRTGRGTSRPGLDREV